MRKKKRRRPMVTFLTVLLVVCAVTGIALAGLSSVTNEETNVFTPSDNIRASLSEPNWNAQEGLKLVPGKTVSKDPMITNTGQVSEYAAIRLTFQYQDGTTAMSGADLLRLLNLLEISWSDKWVLCGGTMVIGGTGEVTSVTQPLIFYYTESLSSGEVSAPVFSSIRVKDKSDGLTEADLRWLQAIKIEAGEIIDDPAGLGRFHILVEGAAVQTQSYPDAAGAASALKGLFP